MSWTKKHLVSTCVNLRAHIKARGWAEDEELIDIWPGECGCSPGERGTCTACSRQSKHEWYMCWGDLKHILGRQDWQTSHSLIAEEEMQKALDAEPAPLRLLDGTSFMVYPKSFATLQFIARHDFQVGWLAAYKETMQYGLLKNMIDPEVFDGQPFQTLELIDKETEWQVACMLEAMVFPGVGHDEEKCNHPRDAFLLTIDPLDVPRILDVYRQVNIGRVTMVPYIVGPPKTDPTQKRLQYSVFYARLARHMNIGDARTLMRDKSLAELLCTVQLSVDTEAA